MQFDLPWRGCVQSVGVAKSPVKCCAGFLQSVHLPLPHNHFSGSSLDDRSRSEALGADRHECQPSAEGRVCELTGSQSLSWE